MASEDNLPQENNAANSNTHSDVEAASEDNSDGSASQQEIEENRLRREIQYMYNTPYGKYKERGQFPYNMIVQILKILFVTIQVSAEIYSLNKIHH